MPAHRILVVDDLTLHRTVLVRLLKSYGVCEEAHDGAEAYERFVSARAEKRPYALICLDIVMPNVDGNEALRMIREEEERACVLPDRRVKILMTTAQNDATSVMTAMKGHCDGYLLKPVQRKSLEEKMKALGFEPVVSPQPVQEKSPPPSAPPQEKKQAAPPSALMPE